MREYTAKQIPLNRIKIRDAFWQKRQEQIAQEIIFYQWDVLNDKIPEIEQSHAMENFKIAAGLSEGVFEGMVFQDSDVAKWIEGASYSLSYHPNKTLEKLLDGAIDLIEAAQCDDGYLNTYFTAAEPDYRLKDITFGHELYCAGHLMEAAAAYYQATGKDRFLRIAGRYVNYLSSVIGEEEHKLHIYPGHEEIELALFKLYDILHDETCLRLAEYFINLRGTDISFFTQREDMPYEGNVVMFHPAYCQAHLPVREQTKAVGHAVRAMYLYCAMADIASVRNDEKMWEVLEKLWDNVTQKQMYITGGIGSQAAEEKFTVDYDLPNDRAYSETCASIGLFFWAHRMNLKRLDAKYGDVMEQALYNVILAGVSLDGKRYFYVNPLEVVPGYVKFREDLNHIKMQRVPWLGCACCPPNYTRLAASLGTYIYTVGLKRLNVNLYIGSEAEFSMGDTKAGIIMETEYPVHGNTLLKLKLEEDTSFIIACRIPAWGESYALYINGEEAEYRTDSGYALLQRTWRHEDEIRIKMCLRNKWIRANRRLRYNCNKTAVMRGPVVYCLEQADNGGNLQDIRIDYGAAIEEEYRQDFLNGTMVLHLKGFRSGHESEALYEEYKEETDPVEVIAIPYYLWNNRGEGEMLVWMNRK